MNFYQRQDLKNLSKYVLRGGLIDTRVSASLQDAVVEALAEISSWPEKETSSRAMQLLSALRQSEFCIARLVLKKVFDYSVVLCKIF